METALSKIEVMPSSREQMRAFTRSLKDEILANDRDPLKILVQLKMIEKVISDVLKDDEIDLHFLKEYQQFEREGEIEVNGVKLRQGETGVKYSYNDSGDPVWFDLDKKIAELTEKKKEREKFLQTVPEPGVVDPDTGVFINRAPKSSKTKVIVVIK
ncbi:MAG: hypothetical protein ABFC18_03390 [Rikenellaceae bacterium]